MTEHTILVAFTVDGSDREHAERALMAALPRPGHGSVTSWWIAEDDRHDGSDNDSAVFVTPSNQHYASRLLNAAGVTPVHNVVTRTGGQFT